VIGIVDYGLGNIASLRNALASLGFPTVFSADPQELSRCRGLILPGVGAFPPAMEKLQASGLAAYLQDWAAKGRPLLGICLGLQLLMAASEEDGLTPGLGLVAGRVVRLQNTPRALHIGWNRVTPRGDGELIPGPGYAYFVHGYVCRPEDEKVVVGTTFYGGPFPSVIRSGRVVGVQFHPEKSQQFGLALLRRFADGNF
jgi:glutamine amidotransferase